MIRAAVVIAGLVLSSSPALARTGNESLEDCRAVYDPNPERKVSWGTGLCLGVVQAIMFWEGRLQICIPEGVTSGQATRILVNYMESRPDFLHYDLPQLALLAFLKQWPCRAGN
jgi:Rap1a immunity proteins